MLGMLQEAQPAVSASPEGSQGLLRGFLELLIFLANAAGGLVVGVAIIRGLALYVVDLVRAHGGEVPKEAIRLSLGRSLALALEFQVGADILGTALDPTLNDILVLAAVVVLRTVLNFFLGRELREAAERERSDNYAAGAVKYGAPVGPPAHAPEGAEAGTLTQPSAHR
jgi:uncharacterized membrane protein